MQILYKAHFLSLFYFSIYKLVKRVNSGLVFAHLFFYFPLYKYVFIKAT